MNQLTLMEPRRPTRSGGRHGRRGPARSAGGTPYTIRMLCVLAMAAGAYGCSGDGEGETPGPDGLPTDPPSRVSLVASEGFLSPADAVASPDGRTFYFTAYTPDEARQAAVFRVSSDGGAVTPLHAGSPLEYPTGLVMSCDGATLFVADMGESPEDADALEADEELISENGGHLYTLSADGGAPAPLEATGIERPTGLALSADCRTLYATGWQADGTPAVFTLPITGGAATVRYAGSPLVSPTGLHVDVDNTAWVMDHLAVGATGSGVLFAITAAGEATEVVSALEMGTPGGVSLTAGGGTAVIPTRDEDGMGQLTTVHIATGELVQVAASEINDPAGLRTAREAAVFAIADTEGNAIYRAE